MPLFRNIIDNEKVAKRSKQEAFEYFIQKHPDITWTHIKWAISVEPVIYDDEKTDVEIDIDENIKPVEIVKLKKQK